MAAIGGVCFAVARLSPPQTQFRSPPLRRWTAIDAQRKLSATRATTTTAVGVAVTQEYNPNTNNVNGENAVIADTVDEDDQQVKRSLRDYFELAKLFVRSSDGTEAGPPRWFSPLESGSRLQNHPLLLYLPGIDGLGLGLVLQHQKLGKMFDVWCLHIPVKDRTPFQELVLLVEDTVRSENRRSPGRPIYLVGESIGGCLALAVAARNPDIDLVLILANPATSYGKSQLQFLLPLLEVVPADNSLINIPYPLSQMTGESLSLVYRVSRMGLNGKQHWSVLADILPRDTLLWKLRMMNQLAILIHVCMLSKLRVSLASGRDPILPNLEEAERIRGALPKQEIRVLKNTGKMPSVRFVNSQNLVIFRFWKMTLI
ncbi:hypothetical protein RDABS01_005770 [Bienertia sinuspersici]